MKYHKAPEDWRSPSRSAQFKSVRNSRQSLGVRQPSAAFASAPGARAIRHLARSAAKASWLWKRDQSRRFFVVSLERLVLAKWRSWLRLMDSYIPREAPLSEALLRLPRFAASAAPAAICCFFDLAGIVLRMGRFRH